MAEAKPAKIPYHIRPMERRDASRVADVVVAAFMNDELHAWVAPKRHDYPLSWRADMTTRIRTRLVSKAIWGIVCVPSPHAYDHDTIMGYAFWERFPGTSKPRSTDAEKREENQKDPWYQVNSGWFAALDRTLLKIESTWVGKLQLNQAMDYKAWNTFLTEVDVEDEVFKPIITDVRRWHLTVLAVDPKYQRKGVGSVLVRWGLDQADEEAKNLDYSVPVTLTASIAGLKLYPYLGFSCVGWMDTPDWAEAGAAFVYDPRRIWIEDAPENTTSKGKKIDALWSERALQMLDKKDSIP